MIADRWELGSLFHLCPVPGPPDDPPPWRAHPHALVGSGRDALRLVLTQLGAPRLWVPSYLCQEVVAAAAPHAASLVVYPDCPLDPSTPWQGMALRPGDAVLTVAYFGLRAAADPVVPDGVAVIEDHTHGPCTPPAHASRAAYCVASLRKLWPLPDGGVAWSPRGLPVPPEPAVSAHLRLASGTKLAGMALKRHYLDGAAVDKPTVRALLAEGEDALLGPEPSGMTPFSRAMLDALPFGVLARRRARAFDHLRERLPDGAGFRVIGPHAPEAVPFSALFVFDDPALRDRVHATLIERRVYASWLWPLDAPRAPGIPESHVALSRRSFSLPLDMRYDLDDIDRAAAAVRAALGGGGS